MSEPVTPGFVRVEKWDVLNHEALLYSGLSSPDSTDWQFGGWAMFRNETDAREFARRWNLHAELVAACEALDKLNWCIGYEMTPENYEAVDRALQLARAAIAKGV